MKRIFALLAIGGLIYAVYAPLRLYDVTEGADKFSVDEIPSFLKDGWFFPLDRSSYNYSQYSNSSFWDIEAKDDVLYVAAGSEGICLFDVSNLDEPNLIEMINYTGGVWGLERDGDYLYLAIEDDGLAIVDITDPLTLAPVGSFTNGSTDWNVTGDSYRIMKRNIVIVEDLLYLCNKATGFSIVNISISSSPNVLGYGFNGTGVTNDIFIEDDLAYVADADDGLEIYNISNPISPEKIGYYYDNNGSIGLHDGRAWGVTVIGDFAYVADYEDGVEIIDVSDPTSPVEVDTLYYSSSYRAIGIDIQNNLMILNVEYGYFYVYDPNNNNTRVTSHAVEHDWGGGFTRGILSKCFLYDDNTMITLDNVKFLTIVELGRDLDLDYIPDWWEQEHGIEDPNADPDFDGHTNIVEYYLVTNPHDSRFALICYILYPFSAILFIGGTVMFFIFRRKEIPT